MQEICRIKKKVQRADIQLDANNAQSTWIWVDNLWLQEEFVYYKNKLDPSPRDQICATTYSCYVFNPNFKKMHTSALVMDFLGLMQPITLHNTREFCYLY